MFSALFTCFSALAIANTGFAAPTSSIPSFLEKTNLLHHAGCGTEGGIIPPICGPEAYKFRPPSHDHPSFFYGSFGVQNYTCDGSTGKYKAAGAVAELFDLSCVLKEESFHKIPDTAFEAWKNADPHVTIQDVTAKIWKDAPELSAGQHYFIKNEAGDGLSPVWDARVSGVKTKGNPNAFVVAKLDTRIPAPTGPQDVDWLALDGVKGGLATRVFRTDTRGGQPPASCSHDGENISVKYYANYILFGASLH